MPGLVLKAGFFVSGIQKNFHSGRKTKEYGEIFYMSFCEK